MREKEQKQKEKESSNRPKIGEVGLSGACVLFDQLHTLHCSQQWLTG